jgi:hypothetical protein
MPAESNASHNGRSCEKTLQELLQGFGGLTRGSASATPRSSTTTRREESPISRRQHLRDPNGYTRKCLGATVGDSHKGRLNN